MALFTLQFVDAVSGSANLRLDLNDQVTWMVSDGTTFEAPRLRRAVSATMMLDGAHVAASAYEPRKLTIVLQLAPLSLDNSATAVQNLSRELDRELNILKYKPGTTSAVYFRVKRSDFTDLTFNEASRRATIELYAEPFAYGEQQTVNGVVRYDPANATNPQYLDVASLKGDVPTPVIFAPDDAIAAAQSVIATWRRPNLSGVDDLTSLVHFVQAENALVTLGTDAALQAVTGFSGSGSNGVRVSFATNATMVMRMSGNWPTSGAGTRGRWRVFVRLKKNTAGDVFFLKFRMGASSTNIYIGGTVSTATTATTNITMVDLGLFSTPYGAHPIFDGASGTRMGTSAAYWELHASRQSGAGTLDIDYIVFIPADDQFGIISWGSTTGATLARFAWDGYNRVVYGRLSNGNVFQKTPASIVGNGALHLSPGVTNRIYFIPDVTPAAQFTNSDTLDIDIYYYPRYLYVRPVST